MQTDRIVYIARQVGALAVAAVTAASTLNGYRPLARKGYPSILSWAFGLVVTEFPLQTLVSQLAGLMLTARRLDPSGAHDRVDRGRPVRAGSAELQPRGPPGRRPADRRVGQRPGDSSPHRLGRLVARGRPATAPPRARARCGCCGSTATTPTTPTSATASTAAPIISTSGDVPISTADGKAPVLFQIPGGAWTTGNKRGQAHPLMSHLAELGWICVAINYRHSPRNTWPDHIVDVKRALAWVKTHIAEYGGDPDFVAITGGSAGGHLSSLAALTPNDPRFQPGFEDADTRVQAAVPFYGVYDFTRFEDAMHPSMPELLEQMVIKQPHTTNREPYVDASPVNHVSADAPPFFVLHGRNDSLVPVEQARASSRGCGTSARSRSCTPNCRSPSTLSTCSARPAPRTRLSPSSNSSPRSTRITGVQ